MSDVIEAMKKARSAAILKVLNSINVLETVGNLVVMAKMSSAKGLSGKVEHIIVVKQDVAKYHKLTPEMMVVAFEYAISNFEYCKGEAFMVPKILDHDGSTHYAICVSVTFDPAANDCKTPGA